MSLRARAMLFGARCPRKPPCLRVTALAGDVAPLLAALRSLGALLGASPAAIGALAVILASLTAPLGPLCLGSTVSSFPSTFEVESPVAPAAPGYPLPSARVLRPLRYRGMRGCGGWNAHIRPVGCAATWRFETTIGDHHAGRLPFSHPLTHVRNPLRRRAVTGGVRRPTLPMSLLGLTVGVLLELSLFAESSARCRTAALMSVPISAWMLPASTACIYHATTRCAAAATPPAQRHGHIPCNAARSRHLGVRIILSVTPLANLMPAALPTDDVLHRDVALALRTGGTQGPALRHDTVGSCFTRENHPDSTACQPDGVSAFASAHRDFAGVELVLVNAARSPHLDACTPFLHGDGAQVLGRGPVLSEV